MNRRGFLQAMLAAAAAPAIVRCDSLMRIVAPSALVLWGDGIHDDTVALQALMDGRPVTRNGALLTPGILRGGSYLISSTLQIGSDTVISGIDVIYDRPIEVALRLRDGAGNVLLEHSSFRGPPEADFPRPRIFMPPEVGAT